MLDSNVGVYRLDVRGKKWYWSFYINTVDIFKSAAFKSFKLVHPDDQMDLLAFTRCTVSYYSNAAKLGKELPPNMIYSRERPWMDNTVVDVDERAGKRH